ncbi:hypothetical protein E2C01_064160 [Portunus trituberculatus]|uniref:Uncharacterized protein n=1 Tax=Portunus trituberculatus TaxID=210409 RepID=A0A5B7HKZ3_PORTR|nr:hypothetical protein [Portunus trituberculatus]
MFCCFTRRSITASQLHNITLSTSKHVQYYHSITSPQQHITSTPHTHSNITEPQHHNIARTSRSSVITTPHTANPIPHYITTHAQHHTHNTSPFTTRAKNDNTINHHHSNTTTPQFTAAPQHNITV